jgi:hypothetical protein
MDARQAALKAIRPAAFKAALALYPHTPPPVVALMMVLVEDHGAPARVDAQGCEITSTCTSSDLFSNPTDAATVDKWFGEHFEHDRPCEECGLPLHGGVPEEERGELGSASVLGDTADGFKIFFLCGWCGENWQCFDDSGLPNICSKLSA